MLETYVCLIFNIVYGTWLLLLNSRVFILVYFSLVSLAGVLGEQKVALEVEVVDLYVEVEGLEGPDVVVGEVEVGVEEEVATSLLLPLKTNWMLI